MRRYHPMAWVLTFMGMTVFSTPVAAIPIVNGGFDTPDIGASFQTINTDNVPSAFGWEVASDDRPEGSSTTGKLGVDLVNSFWMGTGGTSNSDGLDQSVDLDGVTAISQTFPTVLGQSYVLEFDYSHHFARSSSTGFVTVEGGTTLVSETLVHSAANSASDMAWVTFSRMFTADSSSTTLTLAGAFANDSFGFAVDNVSVVPEPAAAVLLGLGLIGLAIQRRRC